MVGSVEDGRVGVGSEVHVSNLVSYYCWEGTPPNPEDGVCATASGKWSGFGANVMYYEAA